MSYILDALNKSERERTENKTPGLNTLHQRADRQETKTPQRWLIVFTFILSLNLVVLAIWYFSDPISPEHQTNVTPRSKPSVSDVIQDPIFSNQAFDRPKNSVERKRPIYEEQKASTDPLSPTGQMRLSEGPPSGSETLSTRVDALDQLAAIRFSSHIFAEDQDLRMVVVDGQRIGEGDIVRDGIRLEQITETGVIFEYQGESFPIDVLNQWAD